MRGGQVDGEIFPRGRENGSRSDLVLISHRGWDIYGVMPRDFFGVAEFLSRSKGVDETRSGVEIPAKICPPFPPLASLVSLVSLKRNHALRFTIEYFPNTPDLPSPASC